MPKAGSRMAIAVGIFIVVVLALILFSTLSLGGYSCEVCMEFAGANKCRTATGSSEKEAFETARDNACAFLASGVTDSIACTNTAPKSRRCQKTR